MCFIFSMFFPTIILFYPFKHRYLGELCLYVYVKLMLSYYILIFIYILLHYISHFFSPHLEMKNNPKLCLFSFFIEMHPLFLYFLHFFSLIANHYYLLYYLYHYLEIITIIQILHLAFLFILPAFNDFIFFH